MSENMNKITDDMLEKVSGGVSNLGKGSAARTITPMWVEVTASELNCREYPNGPILMQYKKGTKLLVDRMSKDGEWYGMEINVPGGGTRVGYVNASYVVPCNDPGSNAVG